MAPETPRKEPSLVIMFPQKSGEVFPPPTAKAEPDTDIVDMLESLLERAKAGYITGLMVIAKVEDVGESGPVEIGTVIHKYDCFTMLGGIAVAHASLANDIAEQSPLIPL